jgi:hypothetical protein
LVKNFYATFSLLHKLLRFCAHNFRRALARCTPLLSRRHLAPSIGVLRLQIRASSRNGRIDKIHFAVIERTANGFFGGINALLSHVV